MLSVLHKTNQDTAPASRDLTSKSRWGPPNSKSKQIQGNKAGSGENAASICPSSGSQKSSAPLWRGPAIHSNLIYPEI